MGELFGCAAEVPQSQEQYFTWPIIVVVTITIQLYCFGCCLLSSKCLDVTVDDVVVSAVLLLLLHSASCPCVLLALLMFVLGCCCCSLFPCALKFYSQWWWLCFSCRLVGVKFAASFIVDIFPGETLLGSWWVVSVVGAHVWGLWGNWFGMGGWK